MYELDLMRRRLADANPRGSGAFAGAELRLLLAGREQGLLALSVRQETFVAFASSFVVAEGQ